MLLFAQIHYEALESNQIGCVARLLWLAQYLLCTRANKWASFAIQGATASWEPCDTDKIRHERRRGATLQVCKRHNPSDLLSEVRTGGGGARTHPSRSLEASRRLGLTPSRILTCGTWLCRGGRQQVGLNVKQTGNIFIKKKTKYLQYFTIRSSGMLTIDYRLIVD